ASKGSGSECVCMGRGSCYVDRARRDSDIVARSTTRPWLDAEAAPPVTVGQHESAQHAVKTTAPFGRLPLAPRCLPPVRPGRTRASGGLAAPVGVLVAARSADGAAAPQAHDGVHRGSDAMNLPTSSDPLISLVDTAGPAIV